MMKVVHFQLLSDNEIADAFVYCAWVLFERKNAKNYILTIGSLFVTAFW